MKCLLGLTLWFAFIWAPAPSIGADLAAGKQQEIDALNESVTEAARLFKQGKYKDCADAVRSAQQKLEALATGADAGLAAALQGVYDRLSKAHSLLELEGVSLPPLKKPDAAGSPKGGSGVRFASEIAPLLVEKCLNCHGRGRRPSGRLNLVTFAGLTRGGDAGRRLRREIRRAACLSRNSKAPPMASGCR